VTFFEKPEFLSDANISVFNSWENYYLENLVQFIPVNIFRNLDLGN
jgi:hypothetical protein